MALLTEDWAYPVVEAHFDPNDPLVNTASEFMFQMAAINYHTLTSTQTVVLEEAVEYNGETFEPGVYEFVCAIPGHTQAGMKGTLTVR
jgi:plastocyanin